MMSRLQRHGQSVHMDLESLISLLSHRIHCNHCMTLICSNNINKHFFIFDIMQGHKLFHWLGHSQTLVHSRVGRNASPLEALKPSHSPV
jgi:hypothetical protein